MVEQLFEDASDEIFCRLIVRIVIVEIKVNESDLFVVPAVGESPKVVHQYGTEVSQRTNTWIDT